MSDRTYCQQKIAGLYCDLEAADRPRFRADLASNIASPDPRGDTYERAEGIGRSTRCQLGYRNALRTERSGADPMPTLDGVGH